MVADLLLPLKKPLSPRVTAEGSPPLLAKTVPGGRSTQGEALGATGHAPAARV